MTQEQTDDVKELAQELYGIFAERTEHSHWDWQPLATQSLEAAEAFFAVYNERYAPQSTTNQPETGSGEPDPTQIATAPPPAQ